MSETIRRYTLVHRPGQTQPELVACEKSDYNAMCYSRDVSLIEAKYAELEAKYAELEAKCAELRACIARQGHVILTQRGEVMP